MFIKMGLCWLWYIWRFLVTFRFVILISFYLGYLKLAYTPWINAGWRLKERKVCICVSGHHVVLIVVSPTLWGLMDCSPLGSQSMGFLRQECLSEFPFLTSGDVPNTGIEPTSLVSPALASEFLPLVPIPIVGAGFAFPH